MQRFLFFFLLFGLADGSNQKLIILFVLHCKRNLNSLQFSRFLQLLGEYQAAAGTQNFIVCYSLQEFKVLTKHKASKAYANKGESFDFLIFFCQSCCCGIFSFFCSMFFKVFVMMPSSSIKLFIIFASHNNDELSSQHIIPLLRL